MLAFILKIELTFAFLKSKNLEFNLVSISAFTFSVGSIGNGCLAGLRIITSAGMISTPFGAFPASCTVPLIATTDSFLSALKSSKMLASTFLLGAVICTNPSLSLMITKMIPPKSLISCTQPIIRTSSPLISGFTSFE